MPLPKVICVDANDLIILEENMLSDVLWTLTFSNYRLKLSNIVQDWTDKLQLSREKLMGLEIHKVY